MLQSILFNIIISFILIFLIHQLWNWLKDNYSIKKTKDLVGSQITKYKSIIEELEKNNINSHLHSVNTLQKTNVENLEIIKKENYENGDYSLKNEPNIDLLDMKADLENFMDSLI